MSKSTSPAASAAIRNPGRNARSSASAAPCFQKRLMSTPLQFARSLLLIGTLSASTFAGAANLVTNGSFELGAFTPQLNDMQSLPVGSGTLIGWTVVGSPAGWIGSANPWGLSASDGSRFLDLTDVSDSAPFSGLTQTLQTTIGQTYRLSFDLGSSSRWGRPNAVRASAGDFSQVFTGASAGTDSDWEHFSMVFTATAASTPLALIGEAGVSFIGLDNVAVSAVPAPAAAWTLGCGLGLLACLGRRSRRA